MSFNTVNYPSQLSFSRLTHPHPIKLLATDLRPELSSTSVVAVVVSCIVIFSLLIVAVVATEINQILSMSKPYHTLIQTDGKTVLK